MAYKIYFLFSNLNGVGINAKIINNLREIIIVQHINTYQLKENILLIKISCI